MVMGLCVRARCENVHESQAGIGMGVQLFGLLALLCHCNYIPAFVLPVWKIKAMIFFPAFDPRAHAALE